MGGPNWENFSSALVAIVGTYGPVGGFIFMAGLVLYRTNFLRGTAAAAPESAAFVQMREDLRQAEQDIHDLQKAHADMREKYARTEEQFRFHWDRMDRQDHRMNNIEQRQR